MIEDLPLPEESCGFLLKNKRVKKCSNPILFYNKFIYRWEKKWKVGEEKKGLLKDVIDISRGYIPEIIKSLNKRQSSMVRSFEDQGFLCRPLGMETSDRLIIGLGGAHVLETGLTLHPLYGFPYIPGSAVKGIARAYAEGEGGADKEEILEIFGSERKDRTLKTNREGKVIFLDALPSGFPRLEVDIMNPHYGEYYRGDKPPADYLSPHPVFFLTVAPGTEFTFYLLSREEDLLDKAAEWLIKGLEELGAGGKTAVGYGYFEKVESNLLTPSADVGKEKSGIKERFKDIRIASNQEKFIKFLATVKEDEVEEFKSIDLKGCENFLNIGIVPKLLEAEIQEDLKRLVAEKLLRVIRFNKKWDREKKERYEKLRSLARRD